MNVFCARLMINCGLSCILSCFLAQSSCNALEICRRVVHRFWHNCSRRKEDCLWRRSGTRCSKSSMTVRHSTRWNVLQIMILLLDIAIHGSKQFPKYSKHNSFKTSKHACSLYCQDVSSGLVVPKLSAELVDILKPCNSVVKASQGFKFCPKFWQFWHFWHRFIALAQLKDLEKLGPKKGVISQSVKDVIDSLVGDDLVFKDKIGTSVSTCTLLLFICTGCLEEGIILTATCPPNLSMPDTHVSIAWHLLLQRIGCSSWRTIESQVWHY